MKSAYKSFVLHKDCALSFPLSRKTSSLNASANITCVSFSFGPSFRDKRPHKYLRKKLSNHPIFPQSFPLLEKLRNAFF